MWRSYLAGHEAHLRRLRSFVPEVYLAVSLRAGGSSAVRRRRRARVSIARGGGLSRCSGSRSLPPIAVAELEALIGEEERAFRRAAGVCRCSGRRTRELQWLLRRAACRGLGEPALDPHWQPAALVVETAEGRLAYEPLECELVRHANAPILEQDRTLVVDAPEGRSFQAMLALGALPEEAEFPGSAELLFGPLEAVEFPVDCVLHARWMGNREAIARVRRRIVDADVAYSRAAGVRAWAAVVCGRGEPAAGARARRLPAVARAAAAA